MQQELSPSFTPNEAAVLADLPAKQIRKEIEHCIIVVPSPPRLSFPQLVYLRVLRVVDIDLSVRFRMQIYKRLVEAFAAQQRVETIPVAELMTLDIGPVVQDMEEKVGRFFRWKEALVTDPAIMGGETVFPNSRLTVRHVGEMLQRGEAAEVILEDYPYLSATDLEFALMHVRAYPRAGRPRARQAAR